MPNTRPMRRKEAERMHAAVSAKIDRLCAGIMAEIDDSGATIHPSRYAEIERLEARAAAAWNLTSMAYRARANAAAAEAALKESQEAST